MKYLTWIMFIVVLSACAPSIKGSSSINTLNLDDGQMVLSPGQTWYLSGKRAAGAFNVEMPQPRFTGTKAGDKQRVMIDDRFEVIQTGLPDGWDFGLYSRVGVQEVVELKTRSRSRQMSWYEYVEFTFALYIPENTPAGEYGTIIAVTANDKVQFIPVSIVVEGQEAPSDAQS